jgi:hypothetical protein
VSITDTALNSELALVRWYQRRDLNAFAQVTVL